MKLSQHLDWKDDDDDLDLHEDLMQYLWKVVSVYEEQKVLKLKMLRENKRKKEKEKELVGTQKEDTQDAEHSGWWLSSLGICV